MVLTKVCVIGGGPGAMFVCHAYNRQRREAQQQGKQLPVELQITCFEKHATAGGIWRDVTTEESDTAAVYEELWTNGPCQDLEFYDYTLEDHFKGEPVPVYLPRRDITEYLVGRVTKETPTFFEDYFQFQTEVVRVQEVIVEEDDSNSNQSPPTFQVTVRNLVTGEESTQHFDKCIWAAGENGTGSIPNALRSLFLVDNHHDSTASALETGGDENKMAGEEEKAKAETVVDVPSTDDTPVTPQYLIPLLHSSETKQIGKAIQQKPQLDGNIDSAVNVLLIGGGLSAEDMALQCLKWGAGHVHVAARDEEGEISWTKDWPGNRVTVHLEMAVQSVEPAETTTDNGKVRKAATIHLQEVKPIWPHGYEVHPEGITETLPNIHLVVCCTGYEFNVSMLDESLVPVGGRALSTYFGSLDNDDTSNRLDLDPSFDWSQWTMAEDRVYFPKLGDVPIAQDIMVRAHYNPPDLHRGIFLKNPNMMFLFEHGHEIPLLSLDIHAWLFCSYLTGYVDSMPSVEEMIQANRQQVYDQMHLPEVRYLMDKAYFDAMWEKLDDDDDDYATEKYMLRLLARIQQEGNYPGQSLGTYEKLNMTGKKLFAVMWSSYYQRTDLKQNIPEDEDVQEAMQWRTFRDDVGEVEGIYSLYTGHVARPLKKRWMDMVGPDHSMKTGI